MELETGCVYRELPLVAHKSRNDNANVSIGRSTCIPQQQRDLSLARGAYEERDCEASRKAHVVGLGSGNLHTHFERHANTSSEYLKALVFGGLDGIVTIFAIVAGCVGAHLSPTQTIIVGIGNLLADAVSMGFGEYVSASTENDFLESEKQREIWEVENYPEGEKNEMMEIYEQKYNFTPEDARTMVDISFKYKDFCISHMMAEELGLLIDGQGPSPINRGGVMFAAFNIFGLVPLAGFTLWCFLNNQFYNNTTTSETQELSAFWVASVVSCITLYILGAVKASFINQNAIKSGLQMVANGAFAGSVAFFVGKILQKNIGGNLID